MFKLSSDEDFYEPDGPSLREVFAKRRQMFAEGRIKTMPEEEFEQTDKEWLRDILACPPVSLQFLKNIFGL